MIANHDVSAAVPAGTIADFDAGVRSTAVLDVCATVITTATVISQGNATREAKSQSGEGKNFEHHDPG